VRIALVLPSLRDPAHRRVAGALSEEYRKLGYRVRVLTGPSRQKAELCHIHFFSRGLAWLGRAAFPDGMRVLLTHQGASPVFMEHPDLFRRVARRADRVTAVSRFGVRELIVRFPELEGKTVHVPNGVFPGARAKRRSPSGRPFLLSVGRVAGYKGLDVMAMAFSRLLDGGRDLDWVVCGPDQTRGGFFRFLKKLGLCGRVRLTGTISERRTALLMRDCAAFVHPSRRENLPMAVLEAMAAGIPIAAARVGGVPELITHRREGLLVPPGDAGRLARAVARLLDDPMLGGSLGRAASMRARSFGWDRCARRYASYF